MWVRCLADIEPLQDPQCPVVMVAHDRHHIFSPYHVLDHFHGTVSYTHLDVYKRQDPRERIFKGFVEQLSAAKHRERDMTLYNNIEELAPEIIAQKRKIYKGVSPNVDFYSGFVYDMLGIPVELYTPIFAVARIVGWSAHRLEEIVGNGKIIRPSYKSVMEEL